MSHYRQQLAALHHSVVSGEENTSLINTISKASVSAKERFAAYSDGYRVRLVNAVLADHPASAHFTGAGVLEKYAHDFAVCTPSRHWDLSLYTKTFAAYLKEQGAQAPLCALATLEGVVAQVFWMADSPALSAHVLAEIGEAGLPDYRFTLRTASTLLHLSHDAERFLKAFREQGAAVTASMHQSDTYIYVYRHQNAVRRRVLSPAEYHLLSLFDQGVRFGDALEQIPEALIPAVTGQLSVWLQEWLEHGVFQPSA